ncbi:MAG: TonB-dependent receptor [Pseudomonadota bacterium]
MAKVMKLPLLASASMIALFVAAPAFAQDATPAPAAVSADDQQSDDGLSEIVVTAQRRNENLQDVPISVATVDLEVAASTGIHNPEALGQLLPGVTFNRQGNGVTPYVRGVGTGAATAGNEPSVALYIDDIYIPTSQASIFDFNNVESIAVLKGPQGTLFGRNATGGVIQIKTKDPSQETEIAADLTYANYNKVSGALYASTGLAPGIAASVAAYGVKQSDGWGRNVVSGFDVQKTESYGVRGKVRAELGPDTTLTLAGNYDWRKTDQGGFNLNIIAGTFGTGGFSATALGAGFYDSVTDFSRPGYTSKAWQTSAKIEHDFGPATFRSITAFGDVRSDAISDLETSPTPFVNAVFTQGSKSFTQEFQLLSSSDNPVTWILGAFYMHDKSDFSITNTGNAFGVRTSRGHGEQKTDSISGFAQLGAELLPRLNATVGLRYTSDRREFLANASLTGPGFVDNISGPFNRSAKYDNITGRAALDYHVDDDTMVYIAYNKGFKSGLFNISGVSGGATAPPPVILPEELNAYTIGFKTELFDRKLRVNVEAYTYDYSNIQVNTVVAGATLITNAAKAKIQGVDIEVTARPVRNLTISGSLSYSDGHYTSFPSGPQIFPLAPNAPIPIPAGCAATVPTYPVGTGYVSRACDLSGNKTTQTVPLSTTLTAMYTIPSSVGEFGLTGSWAHGGDYYFEPDNNPNTRQPVTDIINASVGWTSNSGTYGLSVWGNNLTGQKYYNSISQSTLGSVKYSPAPPRTYGITAKLRF